MDHEIVISAISQCCASFVLVTTLVIAPSAVTYVLDDAVQVPMAGQGSAAQISTLNQARTLLAEQFKPAPTHIDGQCTLNPWPRTFAKVLVSW